VDYQDYYQTLGIAKGAETDDIQKAYRKLARKYHPDINKEPEAEHRFKEINEAYQVLSDPEKRSKYDQFGSAWNRAQSTGAPPPGYEDIFSQFGFGGSGGGGFHTQSSGGDFSSFFETLFGGGQARAQTGWGQGGARSGAGVDHETRISLTLEEAARGGQREIALRGPQGKRKVLNVKIPAGIRPGQKIRLSGQGGPGVGGGSRGDLFLKVNLVPHPHLQLKDSDLRTTLRVAPWEAALGGTAALPTLDGPVTVKIPAGSSSGRQIRLRGKGFPQGKGRAGDLLAEIKIVLPTELTEEEEALLRQLGEVSKFDPRDEQEDSE
jgi:curved DNA-binding protein